MYLGSILVSQKDRHSLQCFGIQALYISSGWSYSGEAIQHYKKYQRLKKTGLTIVFILPRKKTQAET